MAKKKQSAKEYGDRVVAKNRRASFDYELGDRFEAGLVLIGSEVRSLRESSADLTDAWVDIDRRLQATVHGMNIPHMKHAAFGHKEKRPRRLLLHAAEIQKLKQAAERDGMTLIVTQCHFKNNRAKIEICVGRGKKQHDKRHALREKDAARAARVSARRAR